MILRSAHFSTETFAFFFKGAIWILIVLMGVMNKIANLKGHRRIVTKINTNARTTNVSIPSDFVMDLR